MKKETDNLLARYFGGSASHQDMQDLERWISESAENQLEFDQLTQLYSKTGGLELPEIAPDTEKAKMAFMNYIKLNKENQPQPSFEIKPKLFYKNWMFQAASIAVFVVLSLSVWKLFLSEHEMILATQQNLKQEMLPDQTQIKLDPNSKIIYSSHFGKKSKKIKLEGKANFQVGHKGNGTLQINADETLIEDIGTTFTVMAYPDSNEVSVNVNEGKVHFYTKSNKGLILNANETGIYNKKTKEFAIIKTLPKHEEAKHVQFNAMDLKDAMKIIGDEYGVTINFGQKNIANRKITVNFDGENLEMVLEVVAQTLDLKVTKVNNTYLLSENEKPAKQ